MTEANLKYNVMCGTKYVPFLNVLELGFDDSQGVVKKVDTRQRGRGLPGSLISPTPPTLFWTHHETL